MNEDNGNTNGLPMDDERRQRTMEFILEHQAKFHSDIEQLTVNVSELTDDIKQIWRILRMALVAGRRVRSEFRQSQAEIKELREMGYEQDKRITAIIDTNHELQELARRNLETDERHAKTLEQHSENANRNSEAIRELQELAQRNLESAERHLKAIERNEDAIERTSETTNRNAEAIRELQELSRRNMEVSEKNEARWAEVKEAMIEMSKAVKSAHERIDVVEENVEKQNSD
jgi:methyl-accepting chemotaxis protein